MIEAGAWDGIGSSTVGGLIAAATVGFGAVLAYRFAEKARRAESAERSVGERRKAADDLILAVVNLRDATTRSKEGLHGAFALWPLRNQLYLSGSALSGKSCLFAAQQFFWAAEAQRKWLRQALSRSDSLTDSDEDLLRRYRSALDDLADEVVVWLQRRTEEVGAVDVQGRRPLPALPRAA